MYTTITIIYTLDKLYTSSSPQMYKCNIFLFLNHRFIYTENKREGKIRPHVCNTHILKVYFQKIFAINLYNKM